MVDWYPWIKVVHVLAVISWMAGLLYLPRLLIYHFDSEVGSQQSETFKIMERRLLKAIMQPAMIVAWLMGLWMAYLYEFWLEPWFVCKFFLVILMSAMHEFEARWVREFADDKRLRSTRFYRLANEVPTLLMIGIVVLVIARPF